MLTVSELWLYSYYIGNLLDNGYYLPLRNEYLKLSMAILGVTTVFCLRLTVPVSPGSKP